jgi:uncharacterized protein (TIGR03437 family)
MKLIVATAIVALILPALSLADINNATATLAANTTLNLDAGTTGASGGDLLWNGGTLTPQGSATAYVAPTGGGAAGTAIYNSLTQQVLMALGASFSSAAITSGSLVMGAVVAVHTNGGNYAKILVTSNSGGSLVVTFTSYGTTGGGGGGGGTGGGANAPSITDVQNAASNIPSVLPNGGIAQGALFVVKGSNLGPATFIQQTSFPFTTSVGGTSITVTVGGTTVNVVMFYSLAAQVAGILPSKTPTGTGTLKLTYNGQSATFPITVVQNNIGIYTVSTSGSGDAIAFVNADAKLITPTHAANAGDVIVLWGTGLGPVNLDETMQVGSNQADMPNVPLQVYIGGQPAQVNFRGRNGCCTSVDSIYVTVPSGVVGCAVSVLMQVGNMVSNATSIAIADNGRTCTPVNPMVPPGLVGQTGSYKVGGVFLERTVETLPGFTGGTMTTKADAGGASFEKVTYTSAPATGSQLDINSYGSCSVINYKQNTTPPTNTGGSFTPLDAGPAITVVGPGSFGTQMLQKSTIANFYGGQFDQTATTLVPGAYTITGPGGADVGAFTANYTLPPIFAWTDQSTITSVNRANGVTVHWTGGNPSGYVAISGSSIYYGAAAATTIEATFTCTARVSDGSFTVPPAVLLSLPPSGSNIPGVSVIPGLLSVENFDYQLFGPPPGLDAAVVESFFLYGSSVTYQ